VKNLDRQDVMYTELGLYIDGAWRMSGNDGISEEVINPATAKPLAVLPHAGKLDLDQAFAAAENGFAVWKATSAYNRSGIMRKAADLERIPVMSKHSLHA
jgi:succinate-semialdehyde dehydrogenase/glutarate-semialdehyde dehydrogenase